MKQPPSNPNAEILTTILHDERALHAPTLEKLFKELASRIKFTLKVQKASVQLIDDIAFAVIGFRRNGNLLFVEFYSDKALSSQRAEETGQRDGRLIHRVSLHSVDDVNEELIKWIVNSHQLTHSTKP